MAITTSSRELSFQTWGTDGTGDGRRKWASERAQDRRSDANAKRSRDAKLKPDQIVSFLTETYMRVQGTTTRLVLTGRPGATRADAILSRVLKRASSGFVAIAPSAENAAFLAAWLRSPGVNEFCEALPALDRIARTPTPEGQPVKMQIPELLAMLDALERFGSDTAIAAAKHLRTAGIEGCHARVFLTPEAAALTADALHAAGAQPNAVRIFDRVAGRTEPRSV